MFTELLTSRNLISQETLTLRQERERCRAGTPKSPSVVRRPLVHMIDVVHVLPEVSTWGTTIHTVCPIVFPPGTGGFRCLCWSHTPAFTVQCFKVAVLQTLCSAPLDEDPQRFSIRFTRKKGSHTGRLKKLQEEMKAKLRPEEDVSSQAAASPEFPFQIFRATENRSAKSLRG